MSVSDGQTGPVSDVGNTPFMGPTHSEEIAHPTVYNHLSQVSVGNQLSGLAKCGEDSGVQMPLSQVDFCSLSWIYLVLQLVGGLCAKILGDIEMHTPMVSAGRSTCTLKKF